ncbi:hypothetical protein [Maricaulis maris]|uniref:DUF1570 domain-containing protein n=1 Tax=Maricaulis maris TaxID=74318 RepID=A0A495DLW2_9PROT|nr:hypothetical protein [Maricaulis maris]RKR03913.1 hypothetical protein C7435_0356 [Maricaulis maris]
MRLLVLAFAGALACGSTVPAVAQTEAPDHTQAMTTQWRVRPAPGLDALMLLGAASGDALQSGYYSEEIVFIRGQLDPAAVAAMDRIGQRIRSHDLLVGPLLALLFSAGPVDSLQDIITSAGDPDRYLRPGFEASPSWDAERYAGLRGLMPDILTVLEGFRTSGFETWYAERFMPDIALAIDRNLAAVSAHDIIPEQARLLGRDLEPTVEILILNFSQPYGIRIIGQRFIAYHGWPGDTQVRVAAHEIFHPPFDRGDADLRARLAPLESDPWMISIVENHDPAFGYNSFMGVVNEDSTQALDQIVSERIGVGRDPSQRWQHADDGMHMLAAALYHAMKEDGFDERGGRYRDWLISAFDRGLLTPAEVRRRATAIVGADAVARWYVVADMPEAAAD